MQVDDLSEVWRALASPVRRRILDELLKGAVSTGVLSNRFPRLSRFAIMQHLGVLEEGRLVIRKKVGRKTLNYLNPVPIQEIHRRWVARYEGHWAEALVSLKEGLEDSVSGEMVEPKTA